ncbi:MAG: C40 family peptidase [Acidimicrobiales bacterium]|nr:C40 family peptidase [Acidimicrobiales bacterium]
MGIASLAVASPRSGADQLSDAKAQAAAITAKIQATDQQLQSLTDQYSAADYHLSQIRDRVAQTQSQIAQDQVAVDKDRAQLRKQAISDYTRGGTTNQVTDMFSTTNNVAGIRQLYTSIATGNVTTTVDHLHTAQANLQSEQNALQQQQAQATATRDTITAAKNQASALVAQEQATKNSVDATIQNLVVQQQAEAAAAAKEAATAAFNAKLTAAQSIAAQTSAQSAAPQRSGAGSDSGSVAAAPAAPAPPLAAGAAGAVQAAEGEVGVPYVWGGASPSAGFDCSGLIMWAYAQVGIGLPHFSGAQFAGTVHIALSDIQPGDLLFYGPQGADHESMYIGGGQMIEAPHAGANVRIVGVRTDGSTVIGRVQ